MSIQTANAMMPPDDPFDPTRLRLSQDFGEQIGVKKALLTVPVRKPDRQWFVRVRPDPTWRLDTAVLHLKEERETYLVDRPLWAGMPGELVPTGLFTAVNRQDVVFLWPVRLPGTDGRSDEWNRSALKAATMGMDGWVRVAANLSLGAYEVFRPSADLPDPKWPDVDFRGLLEIAFRERFIRSPDHPVLKRLRGEL